MKREKYARWVLGMLACLGLMIVGCSLDDIKETGAACPGLSKIKVEDGSILSCRFVDGKCSIDSFDVAFSAQARDALCAGAEDCDAEQIKRKREYFSEFLMYFSRRSCPVDYTCIEKDAMCIYSVVEDLIICNGLGIDPMSNIYYCGAKGECLGDDHGETCQSGYSCQGGVCSPGCVEGQVLCDGACIVPETDMIYCGASGDCTGDSRGEACPSGYSCQGGVCKQGCVAGQVLCDGACIVPETDMIYCGASGDCTGDNRGHSCQSGHSCQGGVCLPGCLPGQVLCDGACIVPASDMHYCGASGDCAGADRGEACPSGYSCQGGICRQGCVAGQVLCDGACIVPGTDPNHCGASLDCHGENSGEACPSGKSCQGGVCKAGCLAGQILCDGACILPGTDPNFCGASGDCQNENRGEACPSGTSCQGGACKAGCLAGQILCDGACILPGTDPNFCGASGDCQNENRGEVCPSGKSCKGGVCTVECLAGQVVCNEQCVIPETDPNYCGASGDCQGANAGESCPSGYACKNGKCVAGCIEGQVFCNGRCISPETDPTYCGAKSGGSCSDESEESENYRGAICVGGQICSGGKCVCPDSAPVSCQIEPGVFLCTDPAIKNEYCGCTSEAAGENCTLRAGEAGKSYNCVESKCTLTNCDAGETQCGDMCINLFSADANNCGKCGLVCSTQAPPNASAAGCDLGVCRFTCNDGYFNTCLLNAKTEDEKKACTLATNIACVKIGTNTCCGDGCTNCEDMNTDKETFACSAGSCIVSSCKVGQQYCGGECKTVATDKDNCGSCGNLCGEGTACTDGICLCPASQTNCGTDAVPACKNLKEDKDYCGNCGTNCDSIKPANTKVKACSEGECKYECEDGYYNKGGDTATSISCVLIGTNTCCGANCESCDSMASAGSYYMCDQPGAGGKCVKSSCGAGQMLCAGECSSTASDSNNCGACGHKCGAKTNCTNSMCVCSTAGETNCGSDASPQCKNLKTDVTNCGGCNITCASLAPSSTDVAACSAGVCQFSCKAGYYNKGTGTTATTINCVKIGTNTCCGNNCVNCEDSNTSKVTYACSNEKCVESSCGAGELLCGGSCKTVATDKSNCGSCGNVCGSGTACTNGKCQCSAAGTSNCGSDAAPNCVNTQSNANYCGNCATNCSDIAPANAEVATTGCVSGVCQFKCKAGYFNKGTGTTSTTINCVQIGTNTCCGNSCANCDALASNGNYFACSEGECKKSACGSGQMLCNGACSTTATDNSNCGSCGHVCGAGAKCQNGACVCTEAGKTNCGTDQAPQCKSLTSDVSNCGGCGITCASQAPENTVVSACSGSVCQFACADGYQNKGGGVTSATINCVLKGSNACCGNGCTNCEDLNTASAKYSCSDGSCVQSSCGAGEQLCGASCQNTSTSSNHCGACNNKCGSGTSCAAGKCACTAANTTNCGSDASPNCVNTQNNPNFCGNCGTKCSAVAPANAEVANTGCVSGVCQFKCKSGFYNKGTGTTATTINCVQIGTNTCCGNSCTNCDAMASNGVYYTCSNGSCSKSACGAGQMLCGGNCASLNDKATCGSCNKSCGGGAEFICTNGSCVCADNNKTNCGTDANPNCVSLITTSNCGYCGHICGAGTTCTNGNCVCENNKTNCGSDAAPACYSLSSDPSHCGSCQTSCNAIKPMNSSVKAGNSGCVQGVCHFQCNYGYYNAGSGDTAATINCVSNSTATCCGASCVNCNNQKASLGGNDVVLSVGCSAGACQATACKAGYTVSAGTCVASGDATCCGTGCVNCNQANNARAGICDAGTKKCKITNCTSGYHLNGTGVNNSCVENSETACAATNSAVTSNCASDNSKHYAGGYCKNGACFIYKCAPGYVVVNNNTCVPCTPEDVSQCSGVSNAAAYGCSNNQCVVSVCSDGYHVYNGACEPNSNANCGAHGTSCTTSNVTNSTAVACSSAGVCQATACKSNYHVYNGMCEADTALNCGSHGLVCSSLNVPNGSIFTCQNKICKAGACKTGYHVYNGACEENNIANCGSHGNQCRPADVPYSEDMICDGGLCKAKTCKKGFELERGVCVGISLVLPLEHSSDKSEFREVGCEYDNGVMYYAEKEKPGLRFDTGEKTTIQMADMYLSRDGKYISSENKTQFAVAYHLDFHVDWKYLMDGVVEHVYCPDIKSGEYKDEIEAHQSGYCNDIWMYCAYTPSGDYYLFAFPGWHEYSFAVWRKYLR
ncbi:MAG: hypothetical protein IJ165_09200 [Proteobacteria bacterium]|nr:hypothetical protein [Pseudomonadota bacterium]